MDRYSEATCSNALVVRMRAEALAGLRWPSRQRKRMPLAVPPRWTAWLLMDKAGVPRELIAQQHRLPLPDLRKRLRAATAMMMFPPYAARIEALMAQMPPFDAPETVRSIAARGTQCAAQAG
jgi:hypothetical protein